jgi:hypothetical protein
VRASLPALARRVLSYAVVAAVTAALAAALTATAAGNAATAPAAGSIPCGAGSIVYSPASLAATGTLATVSIAFQPSNAYFSPIDPTAVARVTVESISSADASATASDWSGVVNVGSSGAGYAPRPAAATSVTLRAVAGRTYAVALRCEEEGGALSPLPFDASATATATVRVADTARLVSQSIAPGQTLSGVVDWTVATGGPVCGVEYWANNRRLAVVSGASPYHFSLDTTTFANGDNNLGMVLDLADGTKLYPGLGHVTVQNAAPALVAQSITPGQTLSGVVDWTVTTAGAVRAVEYWANNRQLAVVAGASPYHYSLDTTKLANGDNNLGMVLELANGTKLYPGLGHVTVANRLR